MEDLTKHQLILLTLLITFVTSIATGIITYTLLSEAPVEVTQTINRVVEKTIEKVTPTNNSDTGKTVTTVVVSEEDSVLSAISKNEKSIARLKSTAADGTEMFYGMGLVVNSNGIIVADLRSYDSSLKYSVVFYDGTAFQISKSFIDSEDGLVFLKMSVSKNDAAYVFYPAEFGDSNTLKIGQSIVAISGQASNAASIGHIFQLVMNSDSSAVDSILSDIKISKVHLGSPILNLSGQIVGLEKSIVENDTEYSYIPINVIKAATPKALENLNK